MKAEGGKWELGGLFQTSGDFEEATISPYLKFRVEAWIGDSQLEVIIIVRI